MVAGELAVFGVVGNLCGGDLGVAAKENPIDTNALFTSGFEIVETIEPLVDAFFGNDPQ